MPAKKTTLEFIRDAVLVHCDKYDYSKVEYINAKTKVIIICKIHKSFEQIPRAHIKGNGCQKCARITVSNKTKKGNELFIKQANEVHGDRYDYSKVDYKNCDTNIIIICQDHGEFEQTPWNHLQGKNCIKCSLIISGLKRRTNIQDWVEKAKEIHGDKYDYSKVEYKTSHIKVIIICKIHESFEQDPSSHLQGFGCAKCSGCYSYTTEEWIERAKEVHGDRYDYSKVDYKNCDTNIIIICQDHGEFEQTPWNHLQGKNCIKCAGVYNYTTEEWIEKAIQKHGDKYDYSKVIYKNTKTKVIIICKIHGEFLQEPSSHLQMRNCSKCNMCPSCQLWRTNGKLCGYCLPKNKNKLYQKTKEYAVVKYLKDHLPDYDFIHNQSVGSDCTKGEKENSNGHLYPDIRYDCGHYHLIVEVDEHRHRGANYKCDKQRMYDIILKLGLPCIFIRYNPDSQESNKEILLEKIKDYLELDVESDNIWDDYGFEVEYLFY